MGKGEEAPKDNSDKDTASTEDTKDDKVEPEKDEEETPKPSDDPTPKEEVKVEESEEEKNDKDDLRKVIKLDSAEEGEKEQKEPIKDDSEAAPRESLEQKRAILQSIKDFDFLIKKNQEDIGEINQKLDSVTKDLDDLVSLYEIVSEQMNPFVGLSKVTKKRIDALENFTKEIEDLKERTGELESFAERSGAKFKNLGERERAHVKTIDTDAILSDETSGKDSENIEDTESSGELSDEEIQQLGTEIDVPDEEADSITPEETQQPIFVSTIDNNIWDGLSDNDLDIIIERTLGGFSPEGKIDMIIDELIESLKG